MGFFRLESITCNVLILFRTMSYFFYFSEEKSNFLSTKDIELKDNDYVEHISEQFNRTVLNCIEKDNFC